MSDGTQTTAESKGPHFIVLLPVLLFGAVALLFIWGLIFGKGSHIPSVLIGKKVEFNLEPMDGLVTKAGAPVPVFGSKDLENGKVSIVNVWSSWCASCRYEHKYLERLAHKSGAPVYGLNYKDTTSAGISFLKRFGNPYKAVGMDRKGRVGIDLGVYGVPETFILDGKGVIRFKLAGPVNDEIIEKQLLPEIEKARQ